MTHLDLFSGIGGFALAAQTVWGEDYHCVGFCEIDGFCQNVLRKNFEGVTIYGDIRGLTKERIIADSKGAGLVREEKQKDDGADSEGRRRHDSADQDSNGLTVERLAADAAGQGLEGREQESELPERQQSAGHHGERLTIDLLTGGFPCQPFSTAGKRKGTQDDRFLWPEMLRVIRTTHPRWIIGENVDGIIEMALGQVCSDLESLDYEVQPIVIPACAVNAPHRRDRVWIVAANTTSSGYRRWTGSGDGMQKRFLAEIEQGRDRARSEGQGCNSNPSSNPECQRSVQREHGDWTRSGEGIPEGGDRPTSSDSEGPGCEGREREGNLCPGGRDPEYAFPDWSRDWREVAFESCVYRVDDGLPRRVVVLPNGERISESKWRQEALKCYGNSIVPQVAMEIMKAIKAVDEMPIRLEEWA